MSIQYKSLQIVKALEPGAYHSILVLAKTLGLTASIHELKRITHTLCRNGLIEAKEEKDDIKIILTEEGIEVLPFL
ncbi:hypothetical protein [Flammeovirga sp. SJP92]|uniref:hypothetical protein n=1 Tax=Flammeovirga sp. SJP92 TaxID=1775430 RepID=UPI000787EA59|nr:hypothetical protein [Flammeovirga sp. SJP92]KXX66616.1 hypothetical protein AVL50_31465 [Flammeovirga sp. SJP92]